MEENISVWVTFPLFSSPALSCRVPVPCTDTFPTPSCKSGVFSVEHVPIAVLGTFALPALTINVSRVLHFHFWLEKLNFKSEVSLKTSSSCTALVCNWGEGALVQRCLFSGCRILRTSYSRNIPAPVVSRVFNPVN